MIQRFSDDHDPLLLIDFDRTLVDRSRHRLHPSGGSPVFREVAPNVVAMVSGTPSRPAYDPELDLSGEMTIELLCILRQVPGANTYIVSFSASGETDPTNYQWALVLASHDNLRAFWEHGITGTDDSFVTNGAGRGLPQLGVPCVIAQTRKLVGGNLVTQHYVNAEPFGGPSPALPPPTGGSTCTLKLNHSGGPFPELLGLRITPGVRTETELRASRNHCLGEQYGQLFLDVRSLWVGGLTSDGATIVATLSGNSDSVHLVIEGPNGSITSAPTSTVERVARFSVTGLDPDSVYSYSIGSSLETVSTYVGRFRTAPSGPSSFRFACGGDASNGSRSKVFESILDYDPLLFALLGDGHYSNIGLESDTAYHAAYDEMLSSPEQLDLYSRVPTVYMVDDHDSMGNDSHGGSTGRNACCRVYRARVPSHPLVETSPTGSLYHSFDIGRCRFIVTDQRTAASQKSATDNATKSMLGTAQRAWFEDLLSNSPGKLIIWICPRLFGGVATAGADHWGGFTTERAALAGVIHTECPGRVLVLSADGHFTGGDDGSGHDFLLPSGGEPLPTLQASPLDRTPDVTPYGGGSYSEGTFHQNGQWGGVEIEDTGGPSIGVTLRGFDVDGAELFHRSFSVAV